MTFSFSLPVLKAVVSAPIDLAGIGFEHALELFGTRWTQILDKNVLEVMGANIVANVALVFTRKRVGAAGSVANLDVAKKVAAAMDALASAIATG